MSRKTLPRLPNLFATRTTNRYDDTPRSLQDEWPIRSGLHFVDSSSRETSIQDERDNQSRARSSAFWQEQTGLVSLGDFGSTLTMILSDIVKGAK
jgi:hypothetical protein